MPKIALNITELQAEQAELDSFLSRPDAYNDPDFSTKNKRLTELQMLIEKANRRNTLEAQIEEARELSGGDSELAVLAKDEMKRRQQSLKRLKRSSSFTYRQKTQTTTRISSLKFVLVPVAMKLAFLPANSTECTFDTAKHINSEPNSLAKAPTTPVATKKLFLVLRAIVHMPS